MRVLGVAKDRGLVAGLVHTHPNSAAFFSDQDDRNEAELARTAFNKGVSGLASMVFGRDDAMTGRLWIAPSETVTASSISLVGSQIKIARVVAAADEDQFLARRPRSSAEGLIQSCAGCGSASSGEAARAVLLQCCWPDWVSAF